MRLSQRIIAALLLAGALWPLSHGEAATEIFEGTGEYIMEDNETLKQAQDVAYDEAMRHIAQQAAAYVKSASQSADAQITDDEVEMLATALVVVKDKQFGTKIMPDGKFKITAILTAEIDEAATDKALQEKIAELRVKKDFDKVIAKQTEQHRQKDEAQQEYDEALRHTGIVLLDEAADLCRRGDYGGAVAKYDEVIAQYPDYAMTYAQRGEAYRAMSKYDAALRDFDQALKLDPQNADAAFGKAKVFERQGKRKEALENYRRFVEYANIAKDGERITEALDSMAKLEESESLTSATIMPTAKTAIMPSAKAATKVYHATGEYYMNDVENLSFAEQRAIDYAQIQATEMAEVYVESYTRIQGWHITDDVIKLVAMSALKVTDTKTEYKIFPNGNTKITAHITAEISDTDIEKLLRENA